MKADVIVVGGGHAGIEAALAASRMGCSTILLTMDRGAIGRMSCNPAIGGTAKGHLVREIDALGGEMGKIADATGIHFRMLNKSKGPAVWSPRCQNDREWYSREAARRILEQCGLSVMTDALGDISVSGGRVREAVTLGGKTISCRALVLCSGTFLNGLMHTGERSKAGGRFGEPSSQGLSDRLRNLGFICGRLKTGTPPRIDRETIDFARTVEQMPDEHPVPFSFQSQALTNPQIPMYLTYTTEETHAVLKTGFDRSPLFTGRIKGIGPRYCPSIEDKINRFPGRDRHQLYLEPEGYETNIVYLNGFSTSLPEETQQRAVTTIPGLEKARMLRAGYAVEYDFFPPHQVKPTLETRLINGLFFAGQINGTSGYEEAAAQGLIAGINAALQVTGSDEFPDGLTLSRGDAYIGVLVDDLINKSTDEPYRMFTSRAEYRLLLRQDNADSRLMRTGHKFGLIPESAMERLKQKEERIGRGMNALRKIRFYDDDSSTGGVPARGETAYQILKRPEVELESILHHPLALQDKDLSVLLEDKEALDRVQIETKYEGYLARQEDQVRQFEKGEEIAIPTGFDFLSLRSLSNEGREKLQKVHPSSLGQASRISGVTHADLSVLMVALLR